nr:MAG TPA: hypothetical protein [Caudoviricetes sp.]
MARLHLVIFFSSKKKSSRSPHNLLEQPCFQSDRKSSQVLCGQLHCSFL